MLIFAWKRLQLDSNSSAIRIDMDNYYCLDL